MRLTLKPILACGFILSGIFYGCRPAEPSVEVSIAHAEALLDGGHPQQAIAILDGLIADGHERVDVLESLAFAYAAANDPIMASMTFVRMAELVPERPEYLLYAADSLMEVDDTRGASDRYRDYLQVRPRDRAVWIALAELELGFGRNRQALDAYLKAEAIEPRTTQQIAIGELYLRLNNLAQAQAWYGQAVNGDVEARSDALLGLLETAVRSRRFEDAELLLQQLDADYPGHLETSPIAAVRDQLVEWRRHQDEAAAATAALNRPARPAVEAVDAAASPDASDRPAPAAVAPADDSARTSVAEEERSVQEAPVVVARPAPSNPGDAGRPEPVTSPPSPPVAPSTAVQWLQSARQQLAAGDLQTAIRHYRQSLVLDDSPAFVWTELSRAQLSAGDSRAAHASASEAVRRDMSNPLHTLQFLAVVEVAMDSNRLLREMEIAYRRFPAEPDVLLEIARLFEEMGNARNAQRIYEEFLNSAPRSHPDYRRVESRFQSPGG